MIGSMRRIFTGVLAVAVFGFVASNLYALSIICSFDQQCAASVVMGVPAGDSVPALTTDFTIAQATPETAENTNALAFAVMIVGLTSQYLLMLAVLALIVLELAQLHYLKLLFRKRLKSG